MSPTISVLMPAYNAETYVTEAVESILAQTCTDFEFVIVDDGSTDRTKTILEGFAQRDKRIVLVSRPNTGLVGALNDGLAECRGEFVARMDADDIAFPERFERQLEYLSKHGDCVAVGSQVMRIDSDGHPISISTLPETHAEIDAAMIGGKSQMFHPSVMMRTAVLKDIGGYRPFRISEDFDLFLRLAEKGKVENMSEPLLRYRIHKSNFTNNQGADEIVTDGENAMADPVRQTAKLTILRDAYERRQMEFPADFTVKPRRVESAVQFHLRVSKQASKGRHRKTAVLHALRALRSAPRETYCWRVMLQALLG